MDQPEYIGDSDFDDLENDLDRTFQLIANELSASGHAAFANHAGHNLGYHEHDIGDEEDEELDQDSEGDHYAELAELVQGPSSFHSDSDSHSNSDHDPPDSDPDSELPDRQQSPSTAGSQSPGESSTASEDLLFVRQQEGGEGIDAYGNLSAAIAFDFPAPHPLQYRIRQRIAALEGLRRQRVENLLHLDLDQVFHAHLSAAEASLRVESPINLELDDELVEMEFGGVPPGRGRPGEPATVPGEVIDLTNEPDSPEENPETRFRNRMSRHRANPRRQQSLGRTPSLSRSDGSILGAPPVIDLTMEDDGPAARAPPSRPNVRVPAPRLPPPRPQAPASFERRTPGDFRRPIEVADDDNRGFLEMVRRFGRDPLEHIHMHLPGLGGLLRGEALSRASANNAANAANAIPNPLVDNMPNFNYRANGYNNQGQAKPPFIPPPAARPGFGRDTAEDLAFVCPSCEEELKYDPDAGEDKTRPAKRVRSRKDREEHHFWAVKECGHVYCKKCYEDRPLKKTSSAPKTKFRSPNPKTLLCAIEDCNSEVGPKGNWVGLFL